MKAWINEARSLAKAAGRGDIADSRIGAMLSASPNGTDGIWPAEAVREVIDNFDSKLMFDGFWIGRRNRCGVTSRLPRGGKLERNEAAKYRGFATALACEHPRTASLPGKVTVAGQTGGWADLLPLSSVALSRSAL